MKEIEVLGAKSREELIEKTRAALETCNLCEEKVVMEFPKMLWGDAFRGIVQELMPDIEENLKRNGGYMCDAVNFSITGREFLPIYSRFGIK